VERKPLRDVVKKDGMENRAVFFEQPDEGTVRRARATGNLWNTLVCAAKVKELLAWAGSGFPRYCPFSNG
jgi:hypothetical protein